MIFIGIILCCLFPDFVLSSVKVGFTFDAIGHQSHSKISGILDSHNIDATFYYSNNLGTSLGVYRSMFQNGHEIGGQTLSYVDISTLSIRQGLDETCLNRKTLYFSGLKPMTFAYPHDTQDQISTAISKECGYVSSSYGVQSIGQINTQKTPNNVIKVLSIKDGTSINVAKQFINDMANEEFFIMRFYEICDSCSVTFVSFNDLLDTIKNSYPDKVVFMKFSDMIQVTTLLGIPPEYLDTGFKLLPATESKLLVASYAVGGMIVVILLFFLSAYIRDNCKKKSRK